jgi:hypothetical protein
VLLLAMPPPDDLRTLAKRVTHGLIAVVVSEDEVYEGRRQMRDFDNVMFTAVDPAGTIPWRDRFFTLVWAPEESPEVRRVLAPEGTVSLI